MANVDAIAVVKLAVYGILVLPTPDLLRKHGRTGFLGWLYIHIFCVLRIVTGGITLYGNNTSSTATIILNSIGLSPLLLAIVGVLHEA